MERVSNIINELHEANPAYSKTRIIQWFLVNYKKFNQPPFNGIPQAGHKLKKLLVQRELMSQGRGDGIAQLVKDYNAKGR